MIAGILAGVAVMAGAAPVTASDGNLPSISELGDDAWAVLAGSTLKSTLEGWARQSDPSWNVIWNNPNEYRIRASAIFYGNFESVAGRLIDAIHQGNPELAVILYRGNRVVRVDALAISNE